MTPPSLFKNFPNQQTKEVDDDDEVARKELSAAQLAEKRRREKRHPDQGLTAFVRFEDPIPQGHPSGEHPVRWKAESHPGRVMIRLLKQLFAVLPSETATTACTIILIFVLVQC